MSTGCEFYADALADLAAGRLGPVEAGRVEAHLAVCSDCREALDVIRTLRAAPVDLPDRLEARIRRAVRAGGAPAAGPADPGRHRNRKGLRHGWRPWALPLAAAAGLAAWLGVGQLVGPTGVPEEELEVTAEYDPYGAWPASDGVVAGEPVLSDLSVEELEALLEELES
ncbi:MAG: hypothetical protein GWM90_03045 [Gemmatimonadetes bacterium]|nr:hypothetical protein [Gemmatimonadota bacterium]NIQ52595.1 hypothetical protein [Gemmatimonadota bacterium]NIU72734.1 hypothetical protein [Gammaproteobacteria bacterium]NIX43134.1 hypothetical protein [Gemmatimonadota bacterium]NIY07296.1 hypothetical protein [Gemmatimonadota bacterium]